MPMRAVVFDLFHTLVNPEDFRPRGFDRLAEIATIFGIPADGLRAHWLDVVVPAVVASPRPPVDLLADFAVANGGVAGPAERAAADHALGHYQDLALLQPGAAALDATAAARGAGLAVGLLSNCHERDVRVWDRSPLAARFDVALLSCFAGLAKPDPAAYRWVLDRLEVAPDEAAFVGDGGSDEFLGARAAGIGLVVCVAGPAVSSGFRSPGEMDELAGAADVRVEAIDEVPGLLSPR